MIGRRQRRVEIGALRPQVMGEDRAELVVLDLADIGRARAERRDPAMVFAADPPEISRAGPMRP